MGNDGGSIPDRRDLVRSKPKAEQADKANQTRARWFFCALSKRKLQEPIVSCALGKLYNKDALLEYLLDKSAYGDGEKICGHIRSLKDVKTIKLTPNNSPATSSGDESTDRAQFICPLNLKEMNGSQPFVYISTCGCVFSHAGLKALAGSGSSGSSSPKDKDTEEESKDSKPAEQEQLEVCPQCATKYSKADNVRLINPSSEEEEKMRMQMMKQRLSEPPKKSKKRKNASATDESEPPAKKAAAPSMNPTITAASRAVVSSLAMEEAKRKANMSEAVKSLYGDGKSKKEETFMTRGTFTRYA
ncbi:DUF602-domain-containing protein [Dendrothele bispora CBS 962.96]|uniref:DUF602-domain-containing protein n=1 Tax=Dendrothele bispora (strain CBS 962.96) TaxID=1314807 RepID=A0A4S8LPQ6_DENBC|nr:DUF602-domain-containing protein [Dendrothele bispora CBS 962.96]